MVGGNAPPAVDAQHQLLAAADVPNAVKDLKQLAGVALAAKANLALTQTEVAAAAGYDNAAAVRRCEEHGLPPFRPKSDPGANPARGL